MERSEAELTDLGTRAMMLGNMKEALALYTQAIKQCPSYAPAFYNIGILYSETGKYNEALTAFLGAIQRNPQYAEAYCNVGVIYKNKNNTALAVEFYNRALQCDPNFSIARKNLCIALTEIASQTESPKESVKLLKIALYYNHMSSETFYQMGIEYTKLGKIENASVSYLLCLQFNPGYVDAMNNLGLLYKAQSNFVMANDMFMAALNVQPRFAPALNNLGVLRMHEEKYFLALQNIKAALSANPVFASAYRNLGTLYKEIGRPKEAIFCFEKCISIDNSLDYAEHDRLSCMKYLINPPPNYSFNCAQSWGIEYMRKLSNSDSQYRGKGNAFSQATKSTYKLGYVVADYESSIFMLDGVLRHHTDIYQVYCYTSEAAMKVPPGVVHREVKGISQQEITEMIKMDEIDILVDVTGHTSGSLLGVFARKPAPVQIEYPIVGHNTTGLPPTIMNYIITDRIMCPYNQSEQLFTEEPLRMDSHFTIFSTANLPSALTDISVEHLANQGCITFGSASPCAAINEYVLVSWMEILASNPSFRLVIVMNADLFANLMQKFITNSIYGSRIERIDVPRSYQDRLSVYKKMDVLLDTWPSSNHSLEALYMGVPVLTIRGNTLSANLATSAITQLEGMGDWITASVADYTRFAKSLTIQRLLECRKTLRFKMRYSKLMDYSYFISHLESLYQETWANYLHFSFTMDRESSLREKMFPM